MAVERRNGKEQSESTNSGAPMTSGAPDHSKRLPPTRHGFGKREVSQDDVHHNLRWFKPWSSFHELWTLNEETTTD